MKQQGHKDISHGKTRCAGKTMSNWTTCPGASSFRGVPPDVWVRVGSVFVWVLSAGTSGETCHTESGKKEKHAEFRTAESLEGLITKPPNTPWDWHIDLGWLFQGSMWAYIPVPWSVWGAII